MRNIAGSILVILTLLAINSCKNDKCKPVTCVHGTKQNIGGGCTCMCDTNYKGLYCDTLVDRIRYGFLRGNGDSTIWSCSDSCNGSVHYTCTLTGDTANTGVKLLGFENLPVTDTLYLQISMDSLGFLGSQLTSGAVVDSLLGEISANGDTIKVNYSFGNQIANYHCSGVWIKQ